MRYYVNDVEVSKDEYDQMIYQEIDLAEQAASLIPAKPTNRKMKEVKMTATTIETQPTIVEAPVKEGKSKLPKAGSKTATALEIVKRIGLANKEACLSELQNTFGTTKANANAYLFNVKKFLA